MTIACEKERERGNGERETKKIRGEGKLQVLGHYFLLAQFFQGLRDRHLWLSVFSFNPYNNFTRLQRVLCAFTFVFTAMLVNMMFYGVESPDAMSADLGEFNFNYGQVRSLGLCFRHKNAMVELENICRHQGYSVALVSPAA